ncbi:hypothetical protein [Spirosoma linguale]|uniref:hypothetical protein n=1 Tax=Spirosoma linguale TaxID=108 RepID=UPI0001A3B87F
MEATELEEVETQSEAIRDFIGQIPNWLIRWGITVIFLAVLAGIFLSWLIHYPTVVVSGFRLTTQNAPKPIISRTDSRLVRLFVHDNQFVVARQTIGYLESTANHTQVLQLMKRLHHLQQLISSNHFEKLNDFPVEQFQELGELQTPYENFMQSYIQTLALFSNGYYIKRKTFLNQELADLLNTQNQLSQQYNVYDQDAELAQKEFNIHKKLYADKVISTLDYQREESKFIAKRLPIKQIAVSLTTNSTAQTQKRRELTELDRQAGSRTKKPIQASNKYIDKCSYRLEKALFIGSAHFGTNPFHIDFRRKSALKKWFRDYVCRLDKCKAVLWRTKNSSG